MQGPHFHQSKHPEAARVCFFLFVFFPKDTATAAHWSAEDLVGFAIRNLKFKHKICEVSR